MSKTRADNRILPCPGLKITTNAGISFTDSLKRVHDLEHQVLHSVKAAAADSRLQGFVSSNTRKAQEDVGALIRRGDLYPVLRRNARVVLIFDCALTDWKARQLSSQPLRLMSAHRHAKVA